MFKSGVLAVVALVAAALVASPAPVRAAERSEVASFSGRLLDVHKKLVDTGAGAIPPLGARFVYVNEAVTLRLDSFAANGAEPLAPQLTSFLEQSKGGLRARVISDISTLDEAGRSHSLLSLHRKPFGCGVYGPVNVSGRLHFSWAGDEGAACSLEVHVELVTLEGPKGTYGIPVGK